MCLAIRTTLACTDTHSHASTNNSTYYHEKLKSSVIHNLAHQCLNVNIGNYSSFRTILYNTIDIWMQSLGSSCGIDMCSSDICYYVLQDVTPQMDTVKVRIGCILKSVLLMHCRSTMHSSTVLYFLLHTFI